MLTGTAVGDPLPTWLELFIVAAIGIVPVLWMQLGAAHLRHFSDRSEAEQLTSSNSEFN